MPAWLAWVLMSAGTLGIGYFLFWLIEDEAEIDAIEREIRGEAE